MRGSNRHRRTSSRRSGGGTNRVFESSGPDGKVRGNSQQIIEKYLAYSRDAMLSGDRIVAENYTQHAEHYIRLLGQQKEMEAQRLAQANARQANGASGNSRNYKQNSDRNSNAIQKKADEPNSQTPGQEPGTAASSN